MSRASYSLLVLQTLTKTTASRVEDVCVCVCSPKTKHHLSCFDSGTFGQVKTFGKREADC